MKPLPVAPMTSEDFSAWLAGRPDWWVILFMSSIASDRRDAELMLAWRRMRVIARQQMWVPNVGWLSDESEPRWQPVGGQL